MFREYGGEFTADDATRAAAVAPGPGVVEIHASASLWGSGRAALRALLLERKWKRVWIPSYLCAEVKDLFRAYAVYVDHPLLSPAGLPARVEEGEAVLRVNYFGLRGAEEAERSLSLGVDVIEDHTHDPTGPWARASRATFAIASLRKTCPTPDGGLLWSPSDATLPAPIEATSAHLAAANAKLHAMALKGQFLRGRGSSKKEYHALSAAGEARIGSLSGPDPETRTLLARLSPVALSARRRAAWEKLAAATPWTVKPRGEPFALVLDLATERKRDALLRALVDSAIYPSVLWPLSWWWTDGETRAISKRLLTVSTDFRYEDDVVEAVARVLRSLA